MPAARKPSNSKPAREPTPSSSSSSSSSSWTLQSHTTEDGFNAHVDALADWVRTLNTSDREVVEKIQKLKEDGMTKVDGKKLVLLSPLFALLCYIYAGGCCCEL